LGIASFVRSVSRVTYEGPEEPDFDAFAPFLNDLLRIRQQPQPVAFQVLGGDDFFCYVFIVL
jgi:hypothetical protein